MPVVHPTNNQATKTKMRIAASAQALPGIGNGIVRLQSLLGGVKEMHAPSVGVTMFRHSQEIAVRRCRIDTGQHRHRALEDLIMQAHTDAGQVLVVVDDLGLLRGRLQHVMNGADADGHAQQVTQDLHDPAIGAAANQRQRDDHLAQPCLADGQLEQHVVFRRAG
jgi:hypothetical protein